MSGTKQAASATEVAHRPSASGYAEAAGVREPAERRVVIKRDQLRSLAT